MFVKEYTISAKASKEFQTCSRSMTFELNPDEEIDFDLISEWQEDLREQVTQDVNKLVDDVSTSETPKSNFQNKTSGYKKKTWNK